MQIRFVNHASVIFSHKNINLITDPWLFGTAFNNGWELVSKSTMQIEDFKFITHIWFSHEHPDHFNIPVIKSVPEEIRKKITVLFQDTLDHRIINKCREFGFNVIEMVPSKFYTLTEGFKVKCNPSPFYDSWLYADIDNTKVLNLNDCVIDNYKKLIHIHKIIGNIDLLLTQFGYANKIGNPEDKKLRKDAGKKILQRIKTQSDVLNPKFIIPFASFIKFSHVDNAYMNGEINQIEDVERFIKDQTNSEPIILYPGDEWKINEKHDNAKALKLYKDDFAKEKSLITKSQIVPLDDLMKVCTAYRQSLKQRNNWFLITILHYLLYFKTAKIYLKDLEIPITFDLIHGIKKSNFTVENADIITDSDSIDFVFRWDYGSDTLHVNARFRTSGGNVKNFFRMFLVGALNNNGRTLTYLISRKFNRKV